MELSYFLAQLFGLTLAVVSGALFLRPATIRSMLDEVVKNKLVTTILSLAGIMGGLAVVLTHNIWELSWTIFVTLLGWVALIKGTLYLIAPKLFEDLGSKVYSSTNRVRIILFLTLTFGLYLAAVGFQIPWHSA
jgi:hypothetical protein